MKKTVQYLTPEYLERASKMSTVEIVQFLEDFRKLHAEAETNRNAKSRLISIKIPENLLNTFKTAAELEGIKYQTLIKKIMRDWLSSQSIGKQNLAKRNEN